MRIPSKSRPRVKWAGAAITVVLLSFLVASWWWQMYVFLRPTLGVGVWAGLIGVGWETPWKVVPGRVERYLGRRDPSLGLNLWFQVERSPRQTVVFVPIWFLMILAGTPAVLIWWRDRKPPDNACQRCGYSRIGLPTDRPCPECGTPVAR